MCVQVHKVWRTDSTAVFLKMGAGGALGGGAFYGEAGGSNQSTMGGMGGMGGASSRAGGGLDDLEDNMEDVRTLP